MVLLVAEIPTTEGLKMTKIYTDAKGKTLTRKTAFIRSQELNANASGGIWTFEIDKSGNYYLWFQEAAKVSA